MTHPSRKRDTPKPGGAAASFPPFLLSSFPPAAQPHPSFPPAAQPHPSFPPAAQPPSIFLAGHRGMVGSACHRLLTSLGYGDNLILRSSDELDLRQQIEVDDFFGTFRPDIVIFAAGKVGGIHANQSQMAEFLYDNMMMSANAIRAAHEFDVQRFLFLGSTCIYPRQAPQPIPEDSLLSSPLEATNEGYALAKITGLKLCQYYRRQYGKLFHSAMPTNLYGPGDNYHPENSHVLPGLLRRFHEAKESGASSVTIWGSGKALREFLHVDDLARAILHLLDLPDPPDWVNVGSGQEICILDLAHLIADIVGYDGDILLDPSKPDGTPRKLTDTSTLRATGWEPTISLRDGIAATYAGYAASPREERRKGGKEERSGFAAEEQNDARTGVN